MIGGMIPPLAVALATTFFKKKFTSEERKSGVVNYIMGLCFITEGVIPFAAADPLRVIPSCVAGSAVAGGLSMAVWLHPARSAWRHLRFPGCRKCGWLSHRFGSRFAGWNVAAGRIEKR